MVYHSPDWRLPRRKQILLTALAALTAAFGAGVLRAAPDLPQVLISRQLMVEARLKLGAVVVLAADPAGARAVRVRVTGSYEPTPDPSKFNVQRFEARMHLPDIIALGSDPADPQSNESVTAINVRLTDPAGRDAVSTDIMKRHAGLIAQTTARARPGDPFAVLERFHVAIAAVTLIGSTAFLLALMMIRAEERREIVGMLRLIGMSRRSIVLEILIEGLGVAIAGAILGVLLAALAQFGINEFFQARYDTPLVFVHVTTSIALRCVAMALPVGVFTGAAASWTLLRRPPAALVGR
jgi:putative ABC transport system permease protein